VLQLLDHPGRLFAGRAGALEHHEGHDRLAGDVVGTPHHRGFGHRLVRHQRRLDLHRAHAVTGDVQHVVDAAGDREVAGVDIADRAVTREVELALEVLGVIRLLETLRIAPDGADHRRPGALHHEDAALTPGHFGA